MLRLRQDAGLPKKFLCRRNLFSEGNFIEKCLLVASENICLEKRKAFANTRLSRNIFAERISELLENIDSNSVFIRGVDDSTQVTDFVELVLMEGIATDDDIFASSVGTLDKLGVDRAQTVSLATDGAPQMIDDATKSKDKVLAVNPNHQIPNVHCIIHRRMLYNKTLKAVQVFIGRE